jgi:hypothetical protein
MNKRTINLYKEAIKFAYTTVGKEHADTAYFHGVVAGKFAELLITECKSVALDMMCEGYGDSDTLDQFLTEINEHFDIVVE